jgi:hypothetical protein
LELQKRFETLSTPMAVELPTRLSRRAQSLVNQKAIHDKRVGYRAGCWQFKSELGTDDRFIARTF